MCGGELYLVTMHLQNRFAESQMVCSSQLWELNVSSETIAEGTNTVTEVLASNAVTETEVWVSGADTWVVVPVRVAAMTVTTLLEADICYYCRQGDEESPKASSKWHTCMSSIVGRWGGATVVPLLRCVCEGEGAVKEACALVRFGLRLKCRPKLHFQYFTT